MPEDPKDYHYGWMLLRYRPQPLADVPVALLGCETYKRAANRRRWSRWTRAGVVEVPLQGNTTTCVREYARDSAARLRAALDASGRSPSADGAPRTIPEVARRNPPVAQR